ncbi:hypothetical protein YC2023_024982 [Brassica napus]
MWTLYRASKGASGVGCLYVSSRRHNGRYNYRKMPTLGCLSSGGDEITSSRLKYDRDGPQGHICLIKKKKKKKNTKQERESEGFEFIILHAKKKI